MLDSNLGRVVIYEVQNSADVFGTRLQQKDPTSLYVEVIGHILTRYPLLVGQKETHFTTDPVRGNNYTGKKREVSIGGCTVYIKTGFSTKDKWRGINAVCKLAGIEFRLEQAEAAAENHIAPMPQNYVTPKVQYHMMPKEQFRGCFDQQAQYSCSSARVYGRVSNGPAYSTNASGTNYILYKNHIYFLCDKSFIENGTVNWAKDSECAVFGSIDLSTYKMEILKEYQSIGFKKKLRSDSPMVISVSHDKIWYVTYLHDDAGQNKAEPGNLAVKCLDINTRVEAVAMELPKKVREARLPIVMGNVLTYIEGDNLICHNLVTGSESKKQCANILGYNSSYIFFTKSRECHESKITDFYMLDVSNGEAILMRTYLKQRLGIKDPVQRIYYIDCKNNVFYGEISSDNIRTGIENVYHPVIVSLENGSMEVIEPYGLREGGYEFMRSVDGRMKAEAFDGCQYRMTSVVKNGDITLPNGLQEGFYLVRIEKNGKKVFLPCERNQPCGENSSMESSVLVALGDAVIAQISLETIVLYHNGRTIKIFGKG